MIEVVKIKERIRSHLLSHTTVTEDHLAIAGGSLPPPGNMWFRESFSEFSIEYPAQFSWTISGSAVYEVFQAADSDFREAEAVCQTIGEAFLPPLLLTGEGFCIQTQRIAFPASGRESAWNHGSVRITFSVFPV